MLALAKLVEFLRAGYPEAAPPTGYAPLLALLPRRLCDDEVCKIAADLTARGDVPTDPVDIGVAISRITHELPTAEDMDRVKHRVQACR